MFLRGFNPAKRIKVAECTAAEATALSLQSADHAGRRVAVCTLPRGARLPASVTLPLAALEEAAPADAVGESLTLDVHVEAARGAPPVLAARYSLLVSLTPAAAAAADPPAEAGAPPAAPEQGGAAAAAAAAEAGEAEAEAGEAAAEAAAAVSWQLELSADGELSVTADVGPAGRGYRLDLARLRLPQQLSAAALDAAGQTHARMAAADEAAARTARERDEFEAAIYRLRGLISELVRSKTRSSNPLLALPCL